MYKKQLAIIYIILVLCIAVFVQFYEDSCRDSLRKRIQSEMRYNLLTPFWNLEKTTIINRLQHLLLSENALKVVIYHKDGEIFVSQHHQKLNLSWLRQFLTTIGFYYESTIKVPIYMKGENIGHLEFSWLNTNYSVYTYVGILILLIGLIATNYLSLREKHKSLLTQMKTTAETRKLLTKSEEFLATVFESMSDGIAVIDKNFNIIKVNKVQQTKFLKSGCLTGKRCFEAFHNFNNPCNDCPTREVFSTGRPAVKIDIRKDDFGSITRAVEISCYPIKYPDTSEVSRVIERTRDITREKVLERQLRNTEKMSAIGQLAGGIAHDFNNQLTVIIGYAKLLKSCSGDRCLLEESTDKIIKSSRRSSDLCKKLLEFSRQGPLKTEAVNIHHLLVEVIGLLQSSLAKNIKIEEHLNATVPVVTGDPSALQNTFLNLGINACDALTGGGKITFTTFDIEINQDHKLISRFNLTPGNYTQIEITDTGIGMDKKTQEKIFEPFFTTKKRDKGTGMGLPSVYGTICNHKGAITCRSRKEKGTTFTVMLPHADNYHKNDIIKQKNVITGSGSHILLIDDDDEVTEITAIMLKKIGYKCTAINNPVEAVHFYRENRFDIDLVLLDMLMPEMDGKEVFEQLRELNEDVKVIILSGYNENADTRTMLANGALEYILKPFEVISLSEAINKAIYG